MAIQYQGESLVPGILAERSTVEAQLYFGRWEQQEWNGGVIVSTTTDAGHTDQTSQLRPGLILGQNTTSEKLVQWDPYATDGSQRIAGFLNHHIDLELYGAAQDRYSNLLFYAGRIKASEILVPGQAAAGLSGKDYEWLVREQLKHRFIFDDDIYGEYTATDSVITDTTTSLTLTAAQTNTTVSNQGSAAVLGLVLPDPLPGLRYKVLQIGTGGTGQDVNVTTVGAGNDFIDGTEDLGSTVAIDALNFGITEFVGVRSTATLYSYAVNRMQS